MILRVKSQAMTVSLRAPCRFGSARNEGRSTIVRSGTKVARSSDRRTDQEIADEQRMPGVFGEDARPDAEGRVGAAIEILGEQRLALGVGEEVGEQRVEMLDRHRIVVVPPDDRIGVGVADDELVLRAAAGMRRRCRRRAARARRYALRGVAARARRAAARRDSSGRRQDRGSRSGPRRSRGCVNRFRSS